jgi:anaerobic ribonucleoside-triphosphate reductase activating protein
MRAAQLRVSRTHFPVTALGYGTRLGLWLQGCPLACPGCVAQDTWSRDGGTLVPVTELLGEVAEAIDRRADGITVSGGEPLTQPVGLRQLLRGVRALRRRVRLDFDIMLYTGYELHELNTQQRTVSRLADVLVTGRYRMAQPTGLIWRGSANQVLRLQTPLGRARYESFVDYVPERPPIQVEADVDGFWFAGVPAPGTLVEVERDLRKMGLGIDAASWRIVRPRRRASGGGPASGAGSA